MDHCALSHFTLATPDMLDSSVSNLLRSISVQYRVYIVAEDFDGEGLSTRPSLWILCLLLEVLLAIIATLVSGAFIPSSSARQVTSMSKTPCL